MGGEVAVGAPRRRDRLAAPGGGWGKEKTVGGARGLRPPPMPEGEKVLRGQRTAKQVVVGAGGQADAGHVLERKYHGDPVPTEPAENADVSDAAGCEDDGVDPAAQQVVEYPLEARGIILRLGEKRHESRRFEPARDPAQHWGDRRVPEVGDNRGDGPGATPLPARA